MYIFKNPKNQILNNHVIKEKRGTNMFGESSCIHVERTLSVRTSTITIVNAYVV